MTNKFNFYVLFLLFGIIFYVVFFYAVDIYQPTPKSENTPDFSFENIRVSHIYNGNIEMEVYSEKAVIHKGTDLVSFEESHGTLFYEVGQSLLFEASSVNYDLESSSLMFAIPYFVNVTERLPVWFSSEKAYWNSRSQRVTLKGHSKIYYDSMVTEAGSLDFDMKDQMVYVTQKPYISIGLDHEK